MGYRSKAQKYVGLTGTLHSVFIQKLMLKRKTHFQDSAPLIGRGKSKIPAAIHSQRKKNFTIQLQIPKVFKKERKDVCLHLHCKKHEV